MNRRDFLRTGPAGGALGLSPRFGADLMSPPYFVLRRF
jgi:hypothetical protein